jgi:ketosteroid isomerase-like protein
MERDEMQALLERAYARMEAGQLEALLDLYADDAIIQSPSEPAVVGKPAIAEFWQNTFASHRVRLVPSVVECTSFEEIVVVRGRAVGSFEPKAEGTAMPVDSWFLQIYRRDGQGRLRFWRGSNGPLPAGP